MSETVAGIPHGEVDVVEFLERLGIDHVYPGDEVTFSCPFAGHRNSDRNPSASMNAMSTLWCCHGCGRAGNAVSFLAEHQGVSYAQAAQWLRERWASGDGITPTPIEKLLSELRDLDQQDAELRRQIESVVVDEPASHEGDLQRDLGAFLPIIATDGESYLRSRGLWHRRLVDLLEFKFDVRRQRIVIPYFDYYGTVIGYKTREVHEHIKPKYRNWYFPTSDYFYGEQFFAKQTGAPPRGVVVVEGELNALACWITQAMCQQLSYAGWSELGNYLFVGINGSRLSSVQVSKLLAWNSRCVTLAFDSDAAGVTGMRHAAQMLTPRIPTFVADLGGVDFADTLSSSRLQIHAVALQIHAAAEQIYRILDASRFSLEIDWEGF